MTNPIHVNAIIEIPTPQGGIAAYIALEADSQAALANAQAVIDRLQAVFSDYGDALFSPRERVKSIKGFYHNITQAIACNEEEPTGLSLMRGHFPAIQLFSATGKNLALTDFQDGKGFYLSDGKATAPATTPIKKAANNAGYGPEPKEVRSHHFGILSNPLPSVGVALPGSFAAKATASRKAGGERQV